MVTVKQLKAKLKKLGVKKEEMPGRKAELEALLEKMTSGNNGGGNNGGGNGGSNGGSNGNKSNVSSKGSQASVKSIQAAAAAAGPSGVTESAAAAGVEAIPSHSQTRKVSPKASSPQGGKQKTKKARDFLKKSVQKFGTVKRRGPKLKGTKRAGVQDFGHLNNSPMSVNSNTEFTEVTASAWPPQLPKGMSPLDLKRVVSSPSPTFRFGKPMKKLPDYSKKKASIKFKNVHNEPVILRTSWLPPSFNPRAKAIFPILGHNNPLDPGARFNMDVEVGSTVYAINAKGEAVESLVTSGDPSHSPRSTFHKREAKSGKAEEGGLQFDGIKSSPKGKKKKGGRKTRRRRTRRKRRRRRTRKR